jgi:Protein of unknown function (DUF1566)
MRHAWVRGVTTASLAVGLSFMNCIGETLLVAAAPSGNGDTLVDLPQSWSKALPAAERFVILTAFADDAVLDRNTGLVWEKSPQIAEAKWSDARFACINKIIGGQKGWRLPSIPELTSLVDPSVAPPGPTLPTGHPFVNVQSANYWSATTIAESPTAAWMVFFNAGVVLNTKRNIKSQVWCVRGPMNTDAY